MKTKATPTLAPAAVAAGDPVDVPPWRWKEAGCFAFSPGQGTYACVALEAIPGVGDDDPYDVTPNAGAAMDETFEHVESVHARVALGVAIATRVGWEAEVLWRRNDGSDDKGTLVSVAELKDRLAREGFTVAVPSSRRVPLEPNVWTAIGDVEYRYQVDLHEGDASFEYTGELHVRCARDAEPAEVIEGYGLGGPRAVLSHAPGTDLRVLTVETDDGGEGYGDVRRHHWLFDEGELCLRRS